MFEPRRLPRVAVALAVLVILPASTSSTNSLNHLELAAVPVHHVGAGLPASLGANDELLSASTIFGNVYYRTFLPLLLLTLVLAWFTRPKVNPNEQLPEGFRRYSWTYLSVWYIAVAADWLQGPYVYALYESYGFSEVDIAKLFVAGFGSSMLFGTLAGSLADSVGRKRCAILYCVLYGISCMTKHVKLYSVLIVGRVTGGIATSLLFSAFECWMVSEHRERRNFSQALLRYMFSMMYFGMYAVAIVAGIGAQAVADMMPLTQLKSLSEHVYVGGYTAPFDMSLAVLVLAAVAICLMWDENYGDRSRNTTVVQSFMDTCRTLSSNPCIFLLAVIVASFEGCMYAFVFKWTPALESATVPPPHGLIFSLFMMACVCGASTFSLTDPNIRPATVLMPTFFLGAISMGAASVFVREAAVGIIFYGFLVFEFCVGIYFPAIGTLKSDVVPEASRAGVYNAFRIPLNAIVCGLLLNEWTLSTTFALCCGLVIVAAMTLWMFISQRRAIGKDHDLIESQRLRGAKESGLDYT